MSLIGYAVWLFVFSRLFPRDATIEGHLSHSVGRELDINFISVGVSFA